jgi:predicted  nucleic acid-binding Zn-ribbon protein
MNQRTFLYQLQIIDTEIDKFRLRLAEIQKVMNFDDDIKAINIRIAQTEGNLKKLNHSLKKISDETQTIQNKISTSEKSLYDGSIKNPKELQSITAEIESLKKRYSNLDEEQFELLIQIEELEEQLAQQNSELSSLQQSKAVQNQQFQTEIRQIEKEISRLEIEKKPILSQIDEDYLCIYQNLRKTKNKIAVSLIVDNACSMCGNSLPPMEVQRARSSTDDVFCPVCKRILYSG